MVSLKSLFVLILVAYVITTTATKDHESLKSHENHESLKSQENHESQPAKSPLDSRSGRFFPILNNSPPVRRDGTFTPMPPSNRLRVSFPRFPLPWSFLLNTVPGFSGVFGRDHFVPVLEEQIGDEILGWYFFNPFGNVRIARSFGYSGSIGQEMPYVLVIRNLQELQQLQSVLNTKNNEDTLLYLLSAGAQPVPPTFNRNVVPNNVLVPNLQYGMGNPMSIQNDQSTINPAILQSLYAKILMSGIQSSNPLIQAAGYQTPLSTSYQAPLSTSFQAPLSTSYQAPLSTSYQAPLSTSYPIQVPTSYPVPVPTSYPGSIRTSYPVPLPTSYLNPVQSSYPIPVPTVNQQDPFINDMIARASYPQDPYQQIPFPYNMFQINPISSVMNQPNPLMFGISPTTPVLSIPFNETGMPYFPLTNASMIEQPSEVNAMSEHPSKTDNSSAIMPEQPSTMNATSSSMSGEPSKQVNSSTKPEKTEDSQPEAFAQAVMNESSTPGKQSDVKMQNDHDSIPENMRMTSKYRTENDGWIHNPNRRI